MKFVSVKAKLANKYLKTNGCKITVNPTQQRLGNHNVSMTAKFRTQDWSHHHRPQRSQSECGVREHCHHLRLEYAVTFHL